MDGCSPVPLHRLTDYAYDNAGNLTGSGTIINGVRDQFECFRYDYLRRLVEAWTRSAGGTPMCQATKKTGADPYWRTWSYDSIGNRTQQVDKNTDGTTATTWDYLVGTANGVTPHQVKSVSANGLPTREFTYNNDGTTATRTTEAGTAQTLTWDKEGNLASVVEGPDTTSYLYDTNGNRLIARSTAKDTLYLPDGTELEKTSTGVTATRYIGGVAVRTANTLRWIVGNRQATPVCQIDSVTLAVTSRRSLPNGEPRGTQPTWTGTKGYVGGTTDGTGLTHLGAREYDPSLGRFTSGDPVMDLTDPQQWHAYAYANNNPTTFADPTGKLFTADNDGLLLYTNNGTLLQSRPALQPILPPRTFNPRPKVIQLPKIPRVTGWLGTVTLLLSLGGDSPQHQPEEVTNDEVIDKENDCASQSGEQSSYFYFPLDDAGRARGACACLTASAQKTDERAPQTPVGWQPGMERGHLIARELGGTSDRVNIVPMTVASNHWGSGGMEGMRHVERMVRQRLNNGERVFYAAIPRYPTDGPNAHTVSSPSDLRPYAVDIYINSESGFFHYKVWNLP